MRNREIEVVNASSDKRKKQSERMKKKEQPVYLVQRSYLGEYGRFDIGFASAWLSVIL